jgi:gliding motility-associated-like protein
MKYFLQLVILLFLINRALQAQIPINISKHTNSQVFQKSTIIKKPSGTLAENCNNGTDDDGNGLIDMKDYSCYFAAASPDTCIPSKIVWATIGHALYRVDLETNEDRTINFRIGETYGDITWAPNGKLYGALDFSNEIREIDPNTAQSQFVADVPGHYYTNGMTSDAQSILYLTSITVDQKWHVIKQNLLTGQSTIIVDLTANGLKSAGDLTFLNGYLYVSCENSKIAKIDISNNTLQVINYAIGIVGTTAAFGLITLGDGYLYLGGFDNIFRLDSATWVTTLFYTFPRYNTTIFGLSNYGEFCNAPGCRAKLNINIQSSAPYCTNTGVLLKGAGRGINSSNGYTWTLPNGQTKDSDTLRAFTSGKYYLRYHTLPDTCGITDSINLNIIQHPAISLGNDTAICPNLQLLLQPSNTISISSYLWQDGTTAPQYSVIQPGIFWVEGKNVCGVKRDSVVVIADTIQHADIGPDTLLCPQTSIVIKNKYAKRGSVVYKWSTGAVTESITITQPGTYWLEAKNSCGTVRDSITVTAKDSCICKPFFAEINLGADKELCQYDTLIIKNSLNKNGFRYTWQDGSTDNSFVVRQPGIYWAAIATYCNIVRDTVIVASKTNGCSCFVYLPNAFTPNDDSKNDLFKPLSNCGISGEIKIYNRWSNLVYASTDLYTGWDGKYKGSKQPNDVYAYYITYKAANRPGTFSKKGTFILLR